MAIHLNPAKSIEELFQSIGPRAKDLDYSDASMHTVEALLDEASKSIDSMSDADRKRLIEGFGWYMLETGRKLFGGRYSYLHQQNAPVLVTGEPGSHVAMASFACVAGRLAGDVGDNIPFFFEGFSARAKAAAPGDRVLFI